MKTFGAATVLWAFSGLLYNPHVIAAPYPVSELIKDVSGPTNITILARTDPVEPIPAFSEVLSEASANWPDLSFSKPSVFWTGMPANIDQTLPKQFIDQKLGGKGIWFEDVWPKGQPTDEWFILYNKYLKMDLPEEQLAPIIAMASQAYARLSGGDTAYLLIPKGMDHTNPYPFVDAKNPGRPTIWVFFEWNTLSRNDKIKQIMRVDVDLDNNNAFGEPVVIWTKATDGLFGNKAEAPLMPDWQSMHPPQAPVASDGDAPLP